MRDLPDLAGLDAWLAAKEAAVPGLRPNCEKRVIWAREPGARTGTALVFMHGFSATPEEIRPVPDRVAAALGANLHFTRFTGHGQDGPALATATLGAWRADVAEALAIGHALGERVLVMGCSTGCTLATLAAVEGAEIAGLIHVSPNYRLASPLAQFVLDAPGAWVWGPWIAGRERSFEVISDAHEAYWTTRYPTVAAFPMGAAMRAARGADLSKVTIPALFVFSPKDQVVSPAAMRTVMARWGGPVEAHEVACGPEDDAMCHLIAGDIFSPGQTEGIVAVMTRWARGILAA